MGPSRVANAPRISLSLVPGEDGLWEDQSWDVCEVLCLYPVGPASLSFSPLLSCLPERRPMPRVNPRHGADKAQWAFYVGSVAEGREGKPVSNTIWAQACHRGFRVFETLPPPTWRKNIPGPETSRFETTRPSRQENRYWASQSAPDHRHRAPIVHGHQP